MGVLGNQVLARTSDSSYYAPHTSGQTFKKLVLKPKVLHHKKMRKRWPPVRRNHTLLV